MSEPGPSSIPTSADPRSHRPLKRTRPNTTTPNPKNLHPNAPAQSHQAAQIASLFADPSKPLPLPTASQPKTASNMPPPPEIVANVQGSSAGAGSGEFHVYKASRRREYERIRLMEQEVGREKGDEEWEREREGVRRRDEEKTEKNRKRREKRNAAKRKGGNGAGGAGGAGGFKKGVAGGKDEEMAADEPGALATGEDAPVAETPGVIIHDD